jgi:2-oxoglutarate ferredoxin oxidoreductase subunit alpha
MPQHVCSRDSSAGSSTATSPSWRTSSEKFAKKPGVAEANIKVVNAGYHYGPTLHASVPSTYRIETKHKLPGRYMDITGNKATAYGLIAAAERAGLKLYLGSYPITPATDILHELAKHKSLGVITVQCEDEISGCSSAVGAAFAGALAATSTSGPGICLKSEAINLAVIDELPLVVIDVQRGGPSTGLPTKSEQTDLLQALYGRNGESPMPVIAATSPTDCFDAAYMAAKIALEHLTPVVLLTDAFIANGSAAWRLPDIKKMPEIHPHYATGTEIQIYALSARPEEPGALLGHPRTGGLHAHPRRTGEGRSDTGAISTEPENHNRMDHLRFQEGGCRFPVPDLEVLGDKRRCRTAHRGLRQHLRSSLFGHGGAAAAWHKVAMAQFMYVNPLPKNTAEVLLKYNKVVVAEQNLGQLASLLRIRINNFAPYQYNQVKGQPFVVNDLVKEFERVINSNERPTIGGTFESRILE